MIRKARLGSRAAAAVELAHSVITDMQKGWPEDELAASPAEAARGLRQLLGLIDVEIEPKRKGTHARRSR